MKKIKRFKFIITRWFFIHEKDEALKFAKEKNSIVKHEVQNFRTSDGKMSFILVEEIP